MNPTSMDWVLKCSECDAQAAPDGLPSVCACGRPWLVTYPSRLGSSEPIRDSWSGKGMWRYRDLLPIHASESPISLGEGGTPLLRVSKLGLAIGAHNLWLKDEAVNPTGSFKARGIAAAVTRAWVAGARSFTLPTAGNAGVAAAAYGARAGALVRVFAPRTTPSAILRQIELTGATLTVLDGHIGDCGKASREYAAESGAMDLSTLREPYRIEGKKTMGLEVAEQLGWRLPDAVVYPAGGGTGLIGMWKAFGELRELGWVSGRLPKMFVVQSDGCAPIVKAFEAGLPQAEPWVDPWTVASGLRVPAPLGDRLMLRALRESGGAAVSVSDSDLTAAAAMGSKLEGVDFSPEGGATIAAVRVLIGKGSLAAEDSIVIFNTGAGWLYRT